MKTKIYLPLCAGLLVAASAMADDDAGIKIGSRAGAKFDKLATKLTESAKTAAAKTERTVTNAVQRAEQTGHKAVAAAKKTAHKAGEKIEKLTE
jgi:hypothetical protein